MVISAASSLDYDIKDKINEGVVVGVRQKTLANLLNFRPNPYQTAQDFRRELFKDLLLEGNAFIHFDGVFMYHLPAENVEILSDAKTFIRGYRYNGNVLFEEREVFYFKDVSSTSIYRGASRLEGCIENIGILYSMQEFQQKFFDNGTIFGLVLTSENTLSQQAKEKTLQYWQQRYNTKSGGKRPIILDSGLKPIRLSEQTFSDLDFDRAIKTHGERIMTTIGVPPILLQGGNNANIAPNLRLFYLETVLPITRLYISAIERYFGYDVEAVTSNVSALQPDIGELAKYHSTLVNGGIITPNEARIELRYPKLDGGDTIRIPANIAGSAANPSLGGRPSDTKE
ncbi:MAG: phage portal protein [Betaproteobacteria bacterium]|nr:phage portal protein [Betaproteobacteria bacterium]NDA56853.1 phage portal protein [Betaproteobacteria bacterium]NDG58797.1 phage portal protein [Betaproteobacteria bacterium]NDG61283.1 phage portal protein [Betaproteobacteria bacterium]NDH30847.1 phage portal protein [Betaproteobacteria bacterium]